MNFLRAFIGIAVTVALAFILGWSKSFKHPAAFTYVWLGSIAVLLLLRWFL
jgi:hypothetical protein